MSGRYRGRFAPSPSGPLHFGSLVAAVGSYLDARAAGGEWLLRIEDVDTPRNVAGAADDILRVLAALGFEWDGVPVFQSQRHARYREALDQLRRQGDLYPCACSRREIADSRLGPSVDGGHVYPGTCRGGLAPGRAARAWRLRVPDAVVGCVDRVQGEIAHNLAREVGDFVLLRADGQFAYQLAVVVDDADAGITDVVRGADLLDSTPRQLWLQQRLGVAAPRYAHLPVATNAAGEKLSKQTLAPALPASAGVPALAAALRFLGQPLPAGGERWPLAEFWAWAVAHWEIAAVPRRRGIRGPGQCLPP
ncbi:tRNA glutamyl-Q(34) synthetase GluQRS [Azospira restricta]|uniref:Glutamyl-Q tRNA(Asp) synthetase n=1 Tax=Azospira restricta TaxID=404405 RepID=A0A974Y3N5_9RHOO|nr:tRNA glutamyl-Q(34) synthetase GluQRS [Azospira restricta]QRJ64008.1 tRNA glutamyl-Q(34) synthetase GluQRS [Azospira restricta]